MPDCQGMGEMISGQATLAECVRETKYANLSLLSRGKNLPNRSENFLGAEMKECLKSAVAQFDFVIIDSAPVLVADDTTTLAPLIDTTLFVMRINTTPARLAERALGQLYNRQVGIGGVVLNCEHTSASDYRAYGYYKVLRSPVPSSHRGNRDWRTSGGTSKSEELGRTQGTDFEQKRPRAGKEKWNQVEEPPVTCGDVSFC